MESNGFPMCIHVSSATQKLLHDVGEWQYFGCREIKGSNLPLSTRMLQGSAGLFSRHAEGISKPGDREGHRRAKDDPHTGAQ
jgi:hypothetical protein